jgi:hypothetical protein
MGKGLCRLCGCWGVATANSILVVSFAREQLTSHGDAIKAALEAGYTRFRPVLMTASAMIIGMIPMALGLGDGGEQNAPLGRAVIGGLILATTATLIFVPTVFSLLHGRRSTPQLKTPGRRFREHRALEVARWTVSLADEVRRGVHRDAAGGPDHDNGSGESHRCKRRVVFSSVQGQRWRQSHSLRRHAARRARVHDVDDDAGAALPGGARVRLVRPGAPVQGISPHDRHEPLGLASCDDSPIRALRTAPTSVRDIENNYRT